ncbi:DUF2490 domain-containing protein [Pedobacter endophyticus]|uniref:DUF2490 domain-containing protein n=1 Tax=Pedobacter endophyticus TaxID=2789740 RepID=A0A7S9KZN3_9SPHI|nr:DUF2490 domain-containing protein [Pedobacter endophyticus]QPH39544.1 DUF2490 domain-containing protein [Pedobacter endophyticus]
MNEKFDILADVQIRSDNDIRYVSTLLVRGALAYSLNDNNSIALGYAHKSDWTETGKSFEHDIEHRIYQQYQLELQVKKMELELRGRFEQRFIKESDFEFSMRARAFLGLTFPIWANEDFSSGWFGGLQNEIFFNVFKKENANHHFFDQNRPFVSLGYRFNKKMETTFDYGKLADQQEMKRGFTDVFRLTLNTSF